MKTKKSARSATKTPQPEAISPRERTQATAEAVNQAALDAMARGVDAILDQIEAIQTGRVVPERRDPGSLIASLSAKAGSIHEATRKALAAREKRLAGINPALVLAWYRQLDRTERDRILSELHAVDSKRSGLA